MKILKSVIFGMIILVLSLSIALSDNPGLDQTSGKSTTITSPIYEEFYTGEYELLTSLGNESVYDVTFESIEGDSVNFNYTVICLEADFEDIEINSTIVPSVDTPYTYGVPETLNFKKERPTASNNFNPTNYVLNRELIKSNPLSPSNYFEEGDKYVFCYQANPDEDFYLKFGDNSIIITQGIAEFELAYLENVTAKKTAFFLNITEEAPYDNLFSYCPMDIEEHGSTTQAVYDYNDRYGFVMVGAERTTGLYDGGIYFDGDGDYLDAYQDFDFQDNMSFSFWVHHEETEIPNYVRSLFMLETDWYCGYYDYGAYDNVLECYNDIDGMLIFDDCSAYDDNAGDWTYLTFVFNGTNLSVYENGEICGSKSIFLELDYLGTGTNYNLTLIGHSIDSVNDRMWNGTFDELMIFSKALSSDEIEYIYNNDSQRFVNEGTARLIAQPLSETTEQYNQINLTCPNCEKNFNSELSARIGMINHTFNDSDIYMYMPFEWGSSLDISGNYNHLTKTSGTWLETGGINGTGGYDDPDLYTNNLDFNANNEYTLMAWINFDTFAFIRPTIFDFCCDDDEETGFTFEVGTVHPNYYLRVYTSIDGYLGQTGITAETWYHVAVTYDGNDNIEIFIDGQSANTDSGEFYSESSREFRVGDEAGDCGNDQFPGSMDNIIVFERKLSDGEIEAIYSNQSAKHDNIYYTEYQNITTGNNYFTINEEADYVLPDFKLWTTPSTNWYTSLIVSNVTMDAYHSSLDPCSCPDGDDWEWNFADGCSLEDGFCSVKNVTSQGCGTWTLSN